MTDVFEQVIQESIANARPKKRETEFVYIFSPDIFSRDLRYKLGWTTDFSRREKDLMTACPRGRMVFVLPCVNGRKLETFMFATLRKGEVDLIGEVAHGVEFSLLRDLFIRLGLTLSASPETPTASNTIQVVDSPVNPPVNALEDSTSVAPDSLVNSTGDSTPAHAREKLILHKDTHPNTFYYRYLDDESTKKRGPWTREELKLLCETVKEMGEGSWGLIAQRIAGRVGHQCRNAYHKYKNSM